MVTFKLKKLFVNLKSNFALIYNKSHNLLKGAFPQITTLSTICPWNYCPNCLPRTSGGQIGQLFQGGGKKVHSHA